MQELSITYTICDFNLMHFRKLCPTINIKIKLTSFKLGTGDFSIAVKQSFDLTVESPRSLPTSLCFLPVLPVSPLKDISLERMTLKVVRALYEKFL